MAKSKKSTNAFDRIVNSMTPEDKARLDADIDAQIKWHVEHPDHNERYGTDKSYWLEEIRAKGFNPIGITIMACEETIILATQEEVDKAWEVFQPEGWWYPSDKWIESRKWYINSAYHGVESDAPKVYCLDDKFKDIIK